MPFGFFSKILHDKFKEVLDIRDEAGNKAADMFPNGGGWMDKTDMARHMYGTSEMYWKKGKIGQAIVELHELTGINGSKIDKTMDKVNNRIALEIAKTSKTKQEMDTRISDAIKSAIFVPYVDEMEKSKVPVYALETLNE